MHSTLKQQPFIYQSKPNFYGGRTEYSIRFLLEEFHDVSAFKISSSKFFFSCCSFVSSHLYCLVLLNQCKSIYKTHGTIMLSNLLKHFSKIRYKHSLRRTRCSWEDNKNKLLETTRYLLVLLLCDEKVRELKCNVSAWYEQVMFCVFSARYK